MRLAFSMVLLAGLAVGGLGCTKATVIGTSCKTDAECNVAGQVCAPGFNGGPSICTRKCTGNIGTNGCPIGYDCYPTDAAKGSTCNKTLYQVDPMTGKPILFGKDCALDYMACANAGSSNPSPTCRMIEDPSSDPPAPVEIDPNAYCTGACQTDAECPLEFRCAVDYDMAKKCIRRELCSECVVDANCPKEFPVCIPTKDGSSRYCSKPCAYRSDCGGNQNTAYVCDYTTSAAGDSILACIHRFGACVGQGNICDPCRVKADCEKSGSTCFNNAASGERFCSKACNSDAACKSAAGTVATACDNTVEMQSYGLCNGDVDHVLPGELFSCWFPIE